MSRLLRLLLPLLLFWVPVLLLLAASVKPSINANFEYN